MDGTAGAAGGSSGRPARPVTIHDVARAAGVSTSTVSRVLDERLPPSRSAAAQRVREAATTLGYTRDVYAASLRRQGTNTIGVLVPRLSDTVMAILYEELATACEQRSRFAVVATTQEDRAAERAAAESLLRRRVDGLVMTTARSDDDFPAELRARGVPHVLALRTDGVSASSVGDDELGGYLATRHLLDLGHRRVALVAGPDYASSARNRRAGYHRAMAEQGVDAGPELVRESGFSIDAGEDTGHALLTHAPRPTAIFAVNDNTAIGVMAAAHRLNLRVPEDLSVVGYNDIPLVSRLPVPLTSVKVPFHLIAAEALNLLLAPPRAGEQAVHVCTPTLIPRASTTRPAAGT
ncbi:LacI family DNA-binding transcriptional regulator [Actinoalloteichus sp. GBA129-24]|uniref:LacI family DNA-binding transcriptional regulator n=1 Tax=Actinoalloteichus sp. GBA129-24 TaxID=1612551 RepID=UPI000950539C|nr:LacI family DNA-binding transcriptional regulator [Actinoalloteichus sp. GBA129-24]APU22907.1 transcriptional regulator, LacI family [Actinoalloteichus sp. GBA129-24]